MSFELWEKGARVFFAGAMSSSPFPGLIHSYVSDRSQHIRLQIDEIGEGRFRGVKKMQERHCGRGLLLPGSCSSMLVSGTGPRMGGREPWCGAVRAVMRFDGDVWPRLEICN